MKTFDYVIKDPVGIHARPAGVLVASSKPFASKITLTKQGSATGADCKRLFALMAQAIRTGDTVTLSVEGPDEDQAFEAMKDVLTKNL